MNSIQKQVAHLQQWSGLQVRHFEHHGAHHFVFGAKVVCGYRAAKVFAVGIAYGRLT